MRHKSSETNTSEHSNWTPKNLFFCIAHYSPLTWGSPSCLSFIQLARNAFANAKQRGTLPGIGLYSKGNGPTLQKLCPAPIKLLSLIAVVSVEYFS
jgi:hypothetical protein